MVAIQGFEGFFHQIAARRYFGLALAVPPTGPHLALLSTPAWSSTSHPSSRPLSRP
ncbi:hypothetical protein [Hymenobacter terrestris]|uniref:Uncharacterized protein n=1 Tax=Hymenobacter terrestris TaxID=2748310 RepID=A0ABX2Q3I6_9BACT|nr:hypothetical protein [Hymenobacter terrestris]NVO85525.1 hypothetical protein [Hymenobacter terrestris]